MVVKRVLLVLLVILVMVASAGGYFFLRYADRYMSDFFLRSAKVAEDEGRVSRAAFFYEEAVQRNSGNYQALYALALLHKEQGNLRLAEEELLSCIEMSADNTAAYAALSAFYVENGRLSEAVALLNGITSEFTRTKIGAMRPKAPVFFPQPGRYGNETNISLQIEEGITYYYTTDLSFPETTSAVWERDLLLSMGDTTIKMVAVGENGVVSDLTEATYQVSDTSAVVTFKDTTVEDMVRASLSRYTGHITMGDIRSIRSISNKTADGKKIGGEIKSFSDFQHMKELTELNLSDLSNLPDLTGLSVIPQLNSVSLVNCGLNDRDIEALNAVQHLTALNVSDNQIASLTPLAEISGLSYLSLRKNFIGDITPTLLLTNLTYLDLSENPLGNIDVLSLLPGLKSLSLAGCELSSVDPVKGLKSLSYLDISRNHIRSIEPLSECAALETLIAGNNRISGISALAGLPALTIVDLRDNEILSVRALAYNPSIRTLNISRNQIRDLSVLADCELLQTVFATGNPISNETVSVFSGVEIHID